MKAGPIKLSVRLWTTVEHVRKWFVETGLEAINRRKLRRRYERKLDGDAEARLIALACSAPLKGHKQWALRLLAEKLVTLEGVEAESISHETVRLYFPLNLTEAEDMSHNYSDAHANTVRRDHVNRFRENYTRSRTSC